MCSGNEKICVIPFIVKFTLLPWSGTQPTVSLRLASIYTAFRLCFPAWIYHSDGYIVGQTHDLLLGYGEIYIKKSRKFKDHFTGGLHVSLRMILNFSVSTRNKALSLVLFIECGEMGNTKTPPLWQKVKRN